MSDHDQLERDVEAALARLTTEAVPDTRRAPAPPWQQRRRTVDVRRFGRATPWLVAAVLLVLAGLGIGAGVAFDAGGPERGPVGTTLPSPTATVTDSDGTLGGPTVSASPTADRSLDRDATEAPPDDGMSTGTSSSASSGAPTGPFVAGPGSYGPVRVGMSRAAALAALGLGVDAVFPGNGSCSRDIPMPGDTVLGDSPRAVVADASDTVIGFVTAKGVVDDQGHGAGTTLAVLQAAYPNATVVQSQTGWVFVVDTAAGSLGFALDSIPAPTGTSKALSLMPGTADYARGYEVCSG